MISVTERILNCVVLTAQRKLFDGPAEFVVVPLEDGELGIAPGRRELVATLASGELRIRFGNRLLRFFVDGGFVEVLRNRVRVLALEILLPEEIDGEAVLAELDQWQARRCASEEDFRKKAAAIRTLRAKLRVFRR